MIIAVFQHVPFEYPGVIGDWAKANSHEMKLVRSFAGETITDISAIDAAIFLGGPMSVHERDIYPWIDKEENLIRWAEKAGKKVIGICLGAQMIAEVYGGKVSKLNTPEIGWHELEFEKNQTNGTLYNMVSEIFPGKLTAFHWHGETFSIPADATRIASSPACMNQGFIIGENIAAFQFHIEMKKKGINDLAENCQEDIVDSPFVQPLNRILDFGKKVELMNSLFSLFLDRFFDLGNKL